jgi:hypothetical protein
VVCVSRTFEPATGLDVIKFQFPHRVFPTADSTDWPIAFDDAIPPISLDWSAFSSAPEGVQGEEFFSPEPLVSRVEIRVGEHSGHVPFGWKIAQGGHGQLGGPQRGAVMKPPQHLGNTELILPPQPVRRPPLFPWTLL